MYQYFHISFYCQYFKEQKQATLILNASLIGIGFLLVFGLVSFLNNNYPLAVIISTGLGLGTLNVFYLLKRKNVDIAKFNLALICVLLCLGLLVSGGKDNTGVLWTYPILAIVLATLSVAQGKIIIFYYIVGSILLFSFSHSIEWIQEYSYVTASRYIFSLTALTVILLLLVNTQEAYSIKLRKRAITDILTNVFNRAVLKEVSFQKEQRTSVNSSYLILLDVDNFKNINDKFGHDIGDKVLVEIALTLKQAVRKYDYIVRWGGEEFLICLNNTSFKATYDKAEEIRKVIKNNNVIKELLGVPLTISAGVAKVLNEDFDQSVKNADYKLLQSKKTGKNKVTS